MRQRKHTDTNGACLLRCPAGHEWTVRFSRGRFPNALLPRIYQPQFCPECALPREWVRSTPAPGWLHASLQAARVEAARVPAWARRVLAAREAVVFGERTTNGSEMRVIWKYVIHETDRQTVDMPKGARALSVQTQRGDLAIWAQGDPSGPREDRTVLVIGTGHPLPDDIDAFDYVGTTQDGLYVWHVFISRAA